MTPHSRPARRTRRPRHDYGPWLGPLRELRRRMRSARNHPFYVERGNEAPLLQDLMAEGKSVKPVRQPTRH